jgi:hypothetical protein
MVILANLRGFCLVTLANFPPKFPLDTKWRRFRKVDSWRKRVYINVAINDVWVEKYYGPYCPADVLANHYKGGGSSDAFYYEIYAQSKTLVAVVLGYKGQDYDADQRIGLKYLRGNALIKNGNNIFLWDNGQLSALGDRWDLLFTKDFLSIANQQNGLELETQTKIQDDYGKASKPTWPPEDYKWINIQYLGTYNGYIIITTRSGTLPMGRELIIDGVRFFWPHWDERIFAWKDGELFELTDLYEQGLITRENLVAMAYEFNGMEE